MVLYGPDVKLCFFAVCYTDDVSYEHVGYRQVGVLNVDRLRTTSWLCAASCKHTAAALQHCVRAFRLHCTFTAWLLYVCHNVM